MPRTRFLPALLLPGLLALLDAPLLAEEVLLQGGSRLEGVVLERTDAHLILLLPGGSRITLASADVASVASVPDEPQVGQHVRYAEDERGHGRLQVSLVHLVDPRTGVRVDLVGAVHIGDPAYYQAIQAHLEETDLVLFEAVMPEGANAAVHMGSADEEAGGISGLQKKLARLFGAQFQKDAIAYARPHFVNADMSVEAFSGAFAASGQEGDVSDLLGRLSGVDPALLKLVEPFLDLAIAAGNAVPALQRNLKRTFARALGASAGDLGSLMDADLYDLIVRRRNDVVLERLAALPKDSRTVSVFYGAGHMEDLERRMMAAGWRRLGARWLTAWDIPPAAR